MQWKTESRKISDLKPAEWNPRKIDESQKRQLKKSLEKFNLAEIPAINTDNMILAGHQRIMTLLALGRGDEVIDVRVPDRLLTEKEAKEYNLRSNHNTGEWNYDLLGAFDEELLADVGFESTELDKIFDDELPADIDDVPEERAQTDIKIGDLFQLGNHRLMCGDSTKEEDVAKLMNGEKADIVFTDPPYGMRLNADFSGMKGIAGGNKYENVIGDDVDYDPTQLLNLFSYCKEVFLWGADYYAERIPSRNEGCFFVWDKTGSGISPNSAYEKQFGSNFELCWSKGKHKRQIIPVLWKGIFGLSKEDTKKRVHPTQKPVELCKWFLEKFSERDNLAVDLFGGSGSTLIACEQTNRRCNMMELDNVYCAVILDRWEKLTGNKAVKL